MRKQRKPNLTKSGHFMQKRVIAVENKSFKLGLNNFFVNRIFETIYKQPICNRKTLLC